jgi:hypothetical protein
MNSIKVIALLASTDIKVLAFLQIGITKNEQTHVEYLLPRANTCGKLLGWWRQIDYQFEANDACEIGEGLIAPPDLEERSHSASEANIPFGCRSASSHLQLNTHSTGMEPHHPTKFSNQMPLERGKVTCNFFI